MIEAASSGPLKPYWLCLAVNLLKARDERVKLIGFGVVNECLSCPVTMPELIEIGNRGFNIPPRNPLLDVSMVINVESTVILLIHRGLSGCLSNIGVFVPRYSWWQNLSVHFRLARLLRGKKLRYEGRHALMRNIMRSVTS